MLTLEQIQQAVAEAAKSYPIKSVDLFGSYADGTATERSDIDLYVQFSTRPVSFFKVMGFRSTLERMLGKDVDIVKQYPEGEDGEMVRVYES